MGKFEKGNPVRPKATKNRVNSQMRDLIQKLFDDNYQKIQEGLEALKGKIKSQRIGRSILITEDNLKQFLKDSLR